ncbi:MAG: NAD(P)-binding protein [Gammaproteobacteria bacterium]|nr:NAD(P)-binding protein [Gammaproteobacteria bacterium]
MPHINSALPRSPHANHNKHSVVKQVKPVIVVGGGWAGLTAAIELVRHEIPTILLESAKQLGGRARRVPFENKVCAINNSDAETSPKKQAAIPVDNGQHLLIGAYESTLSIFRTIGVREDSILKRQRLTLNIKRRYRRDVKITAGRLPAPLHIAWGLLFARGLSITDRIRALTFCAAMSNIDFTLDKDESCLNLFNRYQQTDVIIKCLWEPLCLATLNTKIDIASAHIFLRMLREVFTHARTDSDFLYTYTDLGATFPEPAMEYIEKNGGNIRLGQRVIELNIKNLRIQGVKLNNTTIECEQVILATPHSVTQKLTAPYTELRPLHDQLKELDHQPICTVYLQYPSNTRLNTEMIGLEGTTSQWIFDRSIYGQFGLMAIVISSDGNHMSLDNDALCELVEKEISELFPQWSSALKRMVIREKRATFHSTTNCNQFRPGNKTAVNGLWVAGDYTNTGLPATLESAVRSGSRCAHTLVKSLQC